MELVIRRKKGYQMRAVFVFTGRLMHYKGHYFSNALPARTWTDRYLKVFDEIVVCTRYGITDNVQGMESSEAENVIFHCTRIGDNPIEMFTKRGDLERHISNEVKHADFVIARMSFLGALGVKYAKVHQKPYVCEVVGSIWDAYWNHSLLGKLPAPYFEWLVKRTVKESPYTIYVTQQYLQEEYPTKGKSIGISNVELPGLSEEILKKRLEKIEIRNEEESLILCTVAAVNVRYKGQQYVIEAISKLKKKGYHFEYWMIGGGDTTYLKKFAEKNDVSDCVTFFGAVKHKDIFEYLDKADIYIQPSLQEGLPRAVVEAMSRGLPVVGANTAGIPELIEQNYVVRRKNVNDICEVLVHYNRESMKKTARRNFEAAKEFEFKRLNDKRIQFLNQAIQNK